MIVIAYYKTTCHNYYNTNCNVYDGKSWWVHLHPHSSQRL